MYKNLWNDSRTFLSETYARHFLRKINIFERESQKKLTAIPNA